MFRQAVTLREVEHRVAFQEGDGLRIAAIVPRAGLPVDAQGRIYILDLVAGDVRVMKHKA